jgi:hypothetical protein
VTPVPASVPAPASEEKISGSLAKAPDRALHHKLGVRHVQNALIFLKTYLHFMCTELYK